MKFASGPSWSIWLEYAFVVAIFLGLGYTFWFFSENGYLPQPWFYEPSGTFMDWYSLTYWSHHRGAYDIAGTIYPPLSFVILKTFSLNACYVNNSSEWARDCDWPGILSLSIIFIINAIVTFLTFRKVDRRTFIPRAVAMSFGLPMLYTYERGNLLLFCYPCTLLAFGPLISNARVRWMFGGMALNFKVYLIGAVLAPLLRRRWLQTEGMLLAAAIVYLATYAILGEGSPIQVYENVSLYASGFSASNPLDLWYASSFVPTISLLKGETVPVTSLLDQHTAEMLLLFVMVVLRSTQLLIVLAALAIWLRPEAVSPYRAVYFAIALAVTTSEVGGYTEILLLGFVFMERWQGVARPFAITLAYILCIPAEHVMGRVVPPLVRWSWLRGGEVVADYGVGLFALTRPLIAVVIVWCLASVTLKDVWADVGRQGWKSRRRYRGDYPIMVG